MNKQQKTILAAIAVPLLVAAVGYVAFNPKVLRLVTMTAEEREIAKIADYIENQRGNVDSADAQFWKSLGNFNRKAAGRDQESTSVHVAKSGEQVSVTVSEPDYAWLRHYSLDQLQEQRDSDEAFVVTERDWMLELLNEYEQKSGQPYKADWTEEWHAEFGRGSRWDEVKAKLAKGD